MEKFIAVMKAIKAALQRAMRAVLDFWKRNKHRLQPFLTAERGRRAKLAWRDAQRTARVLSRHPDLSEADGYLDAWYPGVIRA